MATPAIEGLAAKGIGLRLTKAQRVYLERVRKHAPTMFGARIEVSVADVIRALIDKAMRENPRGT
jgi:hypothetical protein